MSGDIPTRSDLIDVTYTSLHLTLSGQDGGLRPEQIPELKKRLEPRKKVLGSISEKFGKPSNASRKVIESGTVTLPDGVAIQVENADKEYVFAISDKFNIDEIQAFILLRSFLYNQGLPATSGSDSMVVELVEAIGPFFSSEYLHTFRVLLPLFRAKENTEDPLYEIAVEFLPEAIPDGPKFAESIVDEYLRRTKAKLPEKFNEDPRAATAWAKQNLREPLVLLELLFWTMWGYVPCSGPIVLKVFEAAYNTSLGSNQNNNTLLLDDESQQLQQDCAAVWILITIEVLELETLGQDDAIELSDSPSRPDVYYASPDSLKILHDLITSHTDSQYSCTYLAWTYVLSRLSAKAAQTTDIPTSYQAFFDHIYQRSRAHTRANGESMSGSRGWIVQPSPKPADKLTSFCYGAGVEDRIVIDRPNAIAYRSVLKGLIIALVELVPVELVPDFDALVEVWISLFGRSESLSVSARLAPRHRPSAIFDVARSRFPIQVRPLVRLLRAMTGAGFLDTDPLYTADIEVDGPLSEERVICDRFVFHYLAQLSTYSQVIPVSACTGAHALYERQTERYGAGSAGLTRCVLAASALGVEGHPRNPDRLCQPSADGLWLGWELPGRVVREARWGAGEELAPRGCGRRAGPENEEATITDALDLVRSVIQATRNKQAFDASLEDNEPVVCHTMTEAQPPDLEALSRSNTNAKKNIPSSSLGDEVLSDLLAIPNYSNRVWLYIRSTTTLFGSDRTPGFASLALAAERVTGQYTMTLALLQLVGALFREAAGPFYRKTRSSSSSRRSLLRAARFVHSEIWVEHLGGSRAAGRPLRDRAPRRIALRRRARARAADGRGAPVRRAEPGGRGHAAVQGDDVDDQPLVASVSAGLHVMRMLFHARRHLDVRRLIFLLQSHLRLCRIVLVHKVHAGMAPQPCLLEQTLCARSVATQLHDGSHARNDPIDALASYIPEHALGLLVPVEAAQLLCALLTSLSTAHPTSPTIIGHLSKPEAIVMNLIRIIQHPYDDLALRKAIWNFISLAVDNDPALATLFVTGKFRSPLEQKALKEKEEKEAGEKKKKKEDDDFITRSSSALEVAHDILVTWKDLWEANPLLLACVFRFLDVVWQHAVEHKAVVDPLREDAEFWSTIVSVACEEVGPVPTYETTETVVIEGVRRSSLHEAVQVHAYRTLVKSYAIHILTRDIGLHLQLHGSEVPLKKPQSYLKLEPYLKSQEQLNDLLSEAAPSSYAPEMHDKAAALLSKNFPGLTLSQLEVQDPIPERDYGDSFAFSTFLLRTRLQAYPIAVDSMDDPIDEADKLILTINLNLSLVHAETALLEAWNGLLRQVIPYLRTDAVVRPHLLSIAASISFDIASESRSGDMMATIHSSRLSLVLALLEVAWFSSFDKKPEIESFMELVRNLPNMVANEAQSPSRSLLSTLPNPFHRVLLQIIYFVAKQGRSMLSRPKTLNAEQRVTFAQTVDPILTFVIDALWVVFVAARSRADIELDRDMELLVAVFEQCTRPDTGASAVQWLTRCQETNVIGSSLDLFTHIDLVGLSDLPLLLSRKQPLYAPHILLFHIALANKPAAAEHIASVGVLTAYSDNFISSAISSGMIDIVLPELPNQRSPAHLAYCSMVSIVAMVIGVIGKQNHYFDADVVGFVQLYGPQFDRALSWTIDDPITLPLLEEIDQVVNLFYAIAASVPTSAKSNPVVDNILKVFAINALKLLQQINYAITHPNHLASLYEPVTHDERVRFEKAQSQPDATKRSFVTHLIHRLFQLSANIVATLIPISHADKVLSLGPDEWPINQALVAPHSKIVLGEIASLGTLLELGNRTLDILRDLVQRPPGQSIADPSALSGSYTTALGVKEGVIIARRNLEELLLYALTQFAMYLMKPEFEGEQTDMDADDHSMESSRLESTKERRQHQDRRWLRGCDVG
ncbi:hypothetical protein BJ912DRAFT_930157 [Pholiota molesta]|nr:hypothetical protein BJ912DRAFT_930157 [Pholiota molesta]